MSIANSKSVRSASPSVAAASLPPLTHRVCPILERETKTKRLDYAPEPWVLRECLETGLVYLENPPDYSQLAENFAWEVTYQQEVERRAKAEPVSYALRTKFKMFRSRYLSRDKIGGLTISALANSREKELTLLELGCSTGYNLTRVMNCLPTEVANRCTPIGIEISKKLATAADRNLKPFGGTCFFDNALSGIGRLPENSVDAIILCSYLEHEANPAPTLRRCLECLRPGGSITIKVPNFDCMSRYLRGARWCGFRWPDHVNYFTPKTLQALAVQAGFQVARMTWLDHHPLSDNMYAVLKKA
jgi:SAM-dependent methyltransferase